MIDGILVAVVLLPIAHWWVKAAKGFVHVVCSLIRLHFYTTPWIKKNGTQVLRRNMLALRKAEGNEISCLRRYEHLVIMRTINKKLEREASE